MSVCKDCYWIGKPNSPCPCCRDFSHYMMDRGNRIGVTPYTEADFIHTIADSIRAMNDAALARLIFNLGNGREYCYGHCIYQDDQSACEAAQETTDGCIAGVLAWLRSPADKTQFSASRDDLPRRAK